jgi:DNA repair exonuclease SbcCD ATPase subunit
MDKLTRLYNDLQLARRQRKQEKAELVALRERFTDLEEAQRLLQGVAQDVQQRSHEAVATLVTRCLKTVFGEEYGYEFRINFEQRRGRTEADLCFVREGKEIDPTSASGGGVVDLASFALRLACLLLSRPPKRRLLVADECFKHLSRNHTETVRELIETLAAELSLQVILVTHDPSLACGKVVEL